MRHQTVRFHVIFVNISGPNISLNMSLRSKSTLQDTRGRLFPERETLCSDTTGVFFCVLSLLILLILKTIKLRYAVLILSVYPSHQLLNSLTNLYETWYMYHST
jgi:hypothetical protein